LRGAVSFGAVACGSFAVQPSPPEPELQVTGGVTGAVVDLSHINWSPGLADYELAVAGQGKRVVSVWLPEAREPRALVVLLHGAVVARPGRQHADALGPMRELLRCLAAPALRALDPIIIAPGSSTGQWWRREETALVLGLVLAARERWPLAGARSVITGYSNGGIGTWYFARLYPEYFAAAVPMAFNETIAGETPLPVYAIQGTKDEQFQFPAVRDAVQALIQRGRDVTLDAKYRGTHLAVCSYVPELSRAALWLERHVLSRSEGSRAP
jgi:hypothetical protein